MKKQAECCYSGVRPQENQSPRLDTSKDSTEPKLLIPPANLLLKPETQSVYKPRPKPEEADQLMSLRPCLKP